jgi:diguanylate cyclase (GGDEF)-like protein
MNGIPIPALRANVSALMSDYRLVQAEATMETLRRVILLALFTVPMHFGLALWFGYFLGPLPHPELQPWAHALYQAHTITGVIVLALALSAHWVRRSKPRASGFATLVQVLVCVTYLVLGIMVSVEDIRAGNGLGMTVFVLIFIVVASQFLMRPFMSITIYLGALVAFLLVLDTSALPRNLIYGIYVDAIAALLMGILVSVTVWHQYARTVLIRRELSDKNTQLEFLASYDALTGLLNRREFIRLAQMELDRAARYSTNTGVVILDLDRFKDVNDKYGHPAGDAVLQRAAKILTDGVRVSDLVGRLGGEEFIILMPQTGQDGAVALAEKLRQRLSTESVEVHGPAVTITASFGVSTLSSNQTARFEELYLAADRALYRAKELGRNRVEIEIVKANLQCS